MKQATAKMANAKVCKKGVCETSQLLVRGDLIAFVSIEQVHKVGDHPLDEHAMPSDIVLPRSFVLVHDTSGALFNRCHMNFVRWGGGGRKPNNARTHDVQVARNYFGRNVRIASGNVEVPEGPWRRVAKVKYIRYRRAGHARGNYEHPFDPPVYLYETEKPLAWKLKLPNGCIVDDRGFVRP